MEQTHHMLSAEALQMLKPNCNIINFARGELIDTEALGAMYDIGSFRGMYIADVSTQAIYRCVWPLALLYSDRMLVVAVPGEGPTGEPELPFHAAPRRVHGGGGGSLGGDGTAFH